MRKAAVRRRRRSSRSGWGTRVPDPVVADRGALGQFSMRLVRQRDRQPRRFVASAFPVQTVAPDTPVLIVLLCGKELSEVHLMAKRGWSESRSALAATFVASMESSFPQTNPAAMHCATMASKKRRKISRP